MRKKQHNSSLRFLPVAVLAMALVLAVSGTALASSSSGVRELVAEKLANYLDEHPDSAVAHALASFLGGSSDETFGATSASVGGNFDGTTFNNVCFRDPDGDAAICEGWEYGNITAASSTFLSLKNNFPEPIFVDKAVTTLVGAPSTTLQFTYTTSTLSALAYNASTSAELGAPPLIDRYRVSTSTGDTGFLYTFSNDYSTRAYGPTGFDAGETSSTAATGTSRYFPVRQGEYLLGFMRTDDLKWAVTSTNARGFGTGSWYAIHYLRFSTSTPR